MQSAAHYRHSGRVTPMAVVYALAVTFLAGPLLALIYSAATIYIPFIYINLILTGGFGALVGVCVAAAMRIGHTRSTAAVLGMTVLAAVVAYYAHWVFWFCVHAFRADQSFIDALAVAFPPFLVADIGRVNELGTWSLRSSDAVTGWPLTIVWIVEAALYFGAAAFAAYSMASSTVYCESCSNWCAPRLNVQRYAHDQGPTIVSRLQNGDLAVVREAAAAFPEAEAWHQLDLVVCEGCGATNTLSVLAVRNERDKKGNVTTKSDIIVDRLLLTREQAQWVMEPRPAPAATTPWAG